MSLEDIINAITSCTNLETSTINSKEGVVTFYDTVTNCDIVLKVKHDTFHCLLNSRVIGIEEKIFTTTKDFIEYYDDCNGIITQHMQDNQFMFLTEIQERLKKNKNNDSYNVQVYNIALALSSMHNGCNIRNNSDNNTYILEYNDNHNITIIYFDDTDKLYHIEHTCNGATACKITTSDIKTLLSLFQSSNTFRTMLMRDMAIEMLIRINCASIVESTPDKVVLDIGNCMMIGLRNMMGTHICTFYSDKHRTTFVFNSIESLIEKLRELGVEVKER